jgi:hypothetical protein
MPFCIILHSLTKKRRRRSHVLLSDGKKKHGKALLLYRVKKILQNGYGLEVQPLKNGEVLGKCPKKSLILKGFLRLGFGFKSRRLNQNGGFLRVFPSKSRLFSLFLLPQLSNFGEVLGKFFTID